MTNKMTNKQFNEIYRDFSGMAHSKTLSEIAKWLDDHEEYKLINRDEISIIFKNCELLVSITKSFYTNVILKRLCD